ncbi:5-formyltetrahydrofolate cyclo-ligase [Frankia casuarinae]|uniref:5-formyltetrahydrofolate cyclo-ligase n=1 Tax=Frankia TaxID=1854 RepID=UPI0002E2B915|nr:MULTISPECIES: 5-formyltetrahydrofolate cyclo-ligase [Frankia]ETA02020.1 5-formyltetrahydrofolate cyclo-ligase [Frankia sp. CcI6]EYT91792.1 5-formyltetrahydrofolate cyclo-ligase [Frankia casuarinae]KDA40806.1 5-formyltetrahydrofolate cyclo-ligase [Frankia sp. BMG5.23]KFB04225.1 5,10-methenyltetrahydrofolate synthetase [Frankia sp. Allo2]OAA23182.1 5-formyltetrahydrofolate cyclo-ligase [Frankia casuarinae]
MQWNDRPPGDLDEELTVELTIRPHPGPVSGRGSRPADPGRARPRHDGVDRTPGTGPEAGGGSGQIAPALVGGASALGETSEAGEAKARLRARLLVQRRASVALRRGSLSRSDASRLANRIQRLPEVEAARCVAAYVGLPGEPDTAELLDRLLARGVRVLLPALRADLDLDFREHVGTLVPGALGTREPPAAAPRGVLAEADVVIIPALAVDRTGRRLGRGGGSYDRVLARVGADVPVIAVLHDQEVLDEIPMESHDHNVKIIITPSRTLRCEPTDGTGEHLGPSTS